MGLLTQILTQKIAQHHQDEQIARQQRIQTNLGLAHSPNPLDDDPDKDSQIRQYYADLAMKDMSPDAKKTYQRGAGLMGFFHNVLGHRDPGQPSQAASPANALAAPTAQPAQVDQNPGIDIGAGSGPSAPVSRGTQGPSPGPVTVGQGTSPQPSPVNALQRPVDLNPGIDVGAGSGAPPATPQPAFNPATANPWAGENPMVKVQRTLAINRAKAEALGLQPGSAAYNEILATGGPSTVLTERAKLQAGREEAQNTLDELEKRGINVPDTVKAEILANKNLGLGMMMRPVFSPKPVSGAVIPPGTLDMFETPIDPKKDYTMRLNGLGQQEYIPSEIAQRFMQTPGGGIGGVNPLHPGEAPTVVPGAVAPSQNQIITPDLAGGGKGAETKGQALQGTAPTRIPGTVGAGDVNTRESVQTVQGPNGPQLVTVPLRSQKGGGGVGATASPKGAAPGATPPGTSLPANSRVIGNKGLSAEQTVAASSKVEAMSSALDAAQDIRDHADLFRSWLNAKKIQILADPGSGTISILSRVVPATPEEAKLAADIGYLHEGINTVRLALGGQGFRSTQAWDALQQLAGNPAANPEVTKAMLDKTIGLLQNQIHINNQALGRKDEPANRPSPKGNLSAPSSSAVDSLVRKYGGK